MRDTELDEAPMGCGVGLNKYEKKGRKCPMTHRNFPITESLHNPRVSSESALSVVQLAGDVAMMKSRMRAKTQHRQPAHQLSAFFMKHDVLMFPFRYFFDIYPMLEATRLEMSKHFLSEGCRPVIEQRRSYAEYILIITFFHCAPLKGINKKLNKP